MKQIPLNQGLFALVDDCDFEELMKHKWTAFKQPNGRFYAHRRLSTPKGEKQAKIIMHRQILGDTCAGLDVDHKNGNGLDNRRENIRACTRSQNNMNRRVRSHSGTGVKGVYFNKQRNKYEAYITLDRKRMNLGRFDTIQDATTAYNNAAIKNFGEFARLNFQEL